MKDISRVMNRYQIKKPYVIVVGSIEPRKNLDRLFSAWKNLKKEYKDIELVVVGFQGYPFQQVTFRTISNRINFIGRAKDDDLPALYSGAICLVFPSIYEGFGLPPLEAMGCGSPVLSSNTTSMPEVVGDSGLFFDPYDIDDICNCLDRILSNSELRKELRSKGFERARKFTWDRTASQVWDVLINASQEN
jgi:glycosyltransferase involved in cell wall biosynthesis